VPQSSQVSQRCQASSRNCGARALAGSNSRPRRHLRQRWCPSCDCSQPLRCPSARRIAVPQAHSLTVCGITGSWFRGGKGQKWEGLALLATGVRARELQPNCWEADRHAETPRIGAAFCECSVQF